MGILNHANEREMERERGAPKISIQVETLASWSMLSRKRQDKEACKRQVQSAAAVSLAQAQHRVDSSSHHIALQLQLQRRLSS